MTFVPSIPIGLLPLAVLATLWLALWRQGWQPARAILAAAVLWGLLLVVVTEATSAAAALAAAPVAAAWLVALAGSVAWASLAPAGVGGERQAVAGAISKSPLATVGCGVLLAITLVTALVAPPDSWDSMVYHLPRVEHWIQNRSVGHFASHDLKQLYLPPLAEWGILHFRLLTGGERLVNLPAWLAFAGLPVAAAAIAGELGADRRARRLAALVVATLPVAVLEASGTLNDLEATFWALTCVAFLAAWRRGAAPADAALAAASFALGLLTKPTATLAVAPFAVWLVAGAMRRRPAATARLALLVLAATTTVQAGHWWRNARLFDHPLGPPERREVVNEQPGPAAAVSNAMRNLAAHAATPWRRVNERLERATAGIHHRLGLDVAAPGRAWRDVPFRLEEQWRYEPRAGSPLHLALVAVVALAAAAGRPPGLRSYALAATAGYLLACGLLRWQPDNVRLLLPHLALWAPVAGLVLAASPRWTRVGAGVGLGAVALACALVNETRPLLGGDSVLTVDRPHQYFRARPWEEAQLLGLVAELRSAGCRRIALVSNPASYEYPVWALLREPAQPPPRIEHVEVANPSRRLRRPWGGQPPCARLQIYGGVHPDELVWLPPRPGAPG